MKQEIKLIYIGVFKFGFESGDSVSILGLINYIVHNNLKLEEEPDIRLNRSYIAKSGEWFWELEWENDLIKGRRCLVIYFDSEGCHYQKSYSRTPNEIVIEEDGMINKYSEFFNHFLWLSGKKKVH